MSKILTLEEAKDKGPLHYEYNNRDYEYKTEDGYVHLIRDGKDLLDGKKAIDCDSFVNRDYQYQTEDGYYHFIRNNIDLFENLEVIKLESCASNTYYFETVYGDRGLIDNKHTKPLKEI